MRADDGGCARAGAGLGEYVAFVGCDEGVVYVY